ncbi:unnamed protein product [Prorocentrum cordatum]|uniref:Uncharacterized protein n=1 Tax=Prorocentrum cordatum TaxID=2364126 RepID=A0ABN9T0R5_9DINO|nr:unnamed protein product [Polarella glacialis]
MELLGRRGGCRQRAERAEQARAAALLQSAVASFLVQEWAWGRVTPQQCQKIATLLRADLEASASGTLDMGTNVFTEAQWRAQGMDACNPVFQLPGVSILTCAPDWMHVKHSGLDKRLL